MKLKSSEPGLIVSAVAHAALLAVREAKARAKALRDAEIEEDDAIVLELFMERKRRLAAMAVELMQKRRAS